MFVYRKFYAFAFRFQMGKFDRIHLAFSLGHSTVCISSLQWPCVSRVPFPRVFVEVGNVIERSQVQASPENARSWSETWPQNAFPSPALPESLTSSTLVPYGRFQGHVHGSIKGVGGPPWTYDVSPRSALESVLNVRARHRRTGEPQRPCQSIAS